MNDPIVRGGDRIYSPGVFLFTFDTVRQKKFYIFKLCDYILPRHNSILPHLFRFDKFFSSPVLRMKKLGSVLLCFLGVALLKIVYKKANQRVDFYFSGSVSRISVQLNDIFSHKSRAIAGQRGLSLLYQQ